VDGGTLLAMSSPLMALHKALFRQGWPFPSRRYLWRTVEADLILEGLRRSWLRWNETFCHDF
jgi:hypothetical protein